jgi:hypothetical protein
MGNALYPATSALEIRLRNSRAAELELRPKKNQPCRLGTVKSSGNMDGAW